MAKYRLNDYMHYPVRYGVDSETNAATAYFRDFDATTSADTSEQISAVAKDWLTLSGMVCPRNHELIPPGSKPQKGEEVISLPPALAAKFVLRNVMTSQNLRPADLARKLGMSSQSVNALLDVYRDGTRFDAIWKALNACGASIEILD